MKAFMDGAVLVLAAPYAPSDRKVSDDGLRPAIKLSSRSARPEGAEGRADRFSQHPRALRSREPGDQPAWAAGRAPASGRMR
ncbi:hypothetical protein JCM16408A_25310 [Methylobacterium phyllosphaerae]